MKALQRTALYDLHCRLGARMTEFAGFEMPVSYIGVIKEHLAVRSAAGLFDLSHMGEFELRGRHALALLERALTNSAANLREGQAQYSLLCTDDGGTIDDLIVYRLGAERYLLCINAGNIDADREWLLALNRDRAEFLDLSVTTALLGIQGPKAAAVLQALTTLALDQLGRFTIAPAEVAGASCLVARTGYTGEDGFELFVACPAASKLFEALLEAGAGFGLEPCGLGARDTLRLEAGLPLYGHELDRETSPLEAGLGAFIRFGRDFVGAQALARQRAQGLPKRLVGLQTDDGRSVPRQGYRLFRDGDEAGMVTSGTFAPSFNRPLAMAYVTTKPRQTEEPIGLALTVEIRSHRLAATTVALPFYRRDRHAAAAQSRGRQPIQDGEA